MSDRRNMTLLDMVWSMMSRTELPISFWGFTLLTTIFVLNRVPNKLFTQTPYEIWKRKKLNLSFFNIWGCEAYVKHVDNNKIEPKSTRYLFVGYSKETNGYYFYHPHK